MYKDLHRGEIILNTDKKLLLALRVTDPLKDDCHK